MVQYRHSKFTVNQWLLKMYTYIVIATHNNYENAVHYWVIVSELEGAWVLYVLSCIPCTYNTFISQTLLN